MVGIVARQPQIERKRETNIELFRIVTMLLIVAHHYVVNSELYNVIQDTPLQMRTLFLLLFGAWGKTGINCFILITGYFMCRSQLTMRKYAKLLFEVVFYRLVIYFCFVIAGYETLSVKRVLEALLPITSISNGFTSAYLAFMLLIPFLNILIGHMTQKNHIHLVLICVFIYVFLGTLPFLNVFLSWFPVIDVQMNYVSWFVVLFFVGAYFRMYPNPIFDNKMLWGWAIVLLLLISAVSVVVCAYISNQWGWVQISFSYFFLADSNKVLAVSTAVCAFLYFRSLKIPFSKWINKVAASTFGILLIHANSDAMRQWLWVDLLDNGKLFASDFLVLHAVGSVLVVFAVCCCIDFVRIRFVEVPFMKLWDSKIAGMLDSSR